MKDAPTLALHEFLPRTRANGPGLRAALWAQGCSLGCPGCFNPDTHMFRGGATVAVSELADHIAALPEIEGVSLLGGEPLQQRRGALALCERLKATTSLSILLFTGFAREEVDRMPEAERLLGVIDVLIAGRYDEAQRVARGLKGSANKTVSFLSDRYSQADLDAVPLGEVSIGPDGAVVVTGQDPIDWSARGTRNGPPAGPLAVRKSSVSPWASTIK